MFSLVPRCQGLLGSQKSICTPVSTVNFNVLGHLFSLIPGDRAP